MPPTPKAAEAEAGTLDFEAPPELEFSKQAHFSSYSADDDPSIEKDKNPPDGPHVKQELGKPTEGPVKAFGAS